VGDSIGYAIGRRFGPTLRETKLIKKYGIEGWDKATGILRKRGAWAVFFARFLPVVRTLTPAAAGTSGLPYRKFAPAVVAGAACWSAMHIGIGAALGEAAERIEGVISTGGLVVLGVLVVGVLVTVTVRKRRKEARARAAAHVVPVEPSPAIDRDDTDPELEPANRLLWGAGGGGLPGRGRMPACVEVSCWFRLILGAVLRGSGAIL
jgi:hypothetical protein